MLAVAALVLLFGSFFLPNIVADVTDARTLGKLAFLDTQDFSFDSVPILGVADRIELVANRHIERIPLDTAGQREIAIAADKAISELERCIRGGPLEFDFRRCTVGEGGAVFLIDTAEPSVNMVVWEFILNDPAENTITATLDDETGLIVKVIYKSASEADETGSDNEDKLYEIAFEMIKMVERYYRLPVVLADYTRNSNIAYYKAELTSGDKVVPMYGIVRAHIFTMNEQA